MVVPTIHSCNSVQLPDKVPALLHTDAHELLLRTEKQVMKTMRIKVIEAIVLVHQ